MSAYQSIFPKRTKPTRAADFAAASGLTYAAKSDPSALTEKDLTAWDNVVPLAPEDIRSILAADLGENVQVKINFNVEGDLKVKVGHESSDDLDVSFCVNFNGAPQIHTLNVRSNIKGQGLGKKGMRNAMEFAVALGASDFRFSAGMENGANQWSKVGVQVITKHVDPEDRLKLTSRIEPVKSLLSEQQYFFAKQCCSLSHPDHMANLVELGHIVVPPNYDARLASVAESTKVSIERFYLSQGYRAATASLNAHTAVSQIAKTFDEACKGEGIPLPAYIQARFSYPAIVDFRNAERTEIIGERLGGWRNIAPL